MYFRFPNTACKVISPCSESP